MREDGFLWWLIAMLLVLLLLTGCDQPVKSEDALRIHYLKDHRTGLCFAAYQWGRGGSITNVPCISEVLVLIQ